MSVKQFITDDFLLENKFSQELYNKYSKDKPIIDYHNHLSPKEIAEDKIYNNITELWFAGDHAKFRAMRTCGISEKYITGNATDREKFIAWAGTVPYTLRNPLFHWTHLELKRYFGISDMLNKENANEIYDEIDFQLKKPENSCRGLLNKMNVESLCTTEDPVDNLSYHKIISDSKFKIKVSTAFRPDKSLLIEAHDYNEYIDELGKISGIVINSFGDLQDALRNRIEYFHSNGCRLSDHGLNYIPFADYKDSEIKSIFKKKRDGDVISESDTNKFKTSLLLYLSEIYHELEWVQQFHLGALRNNNTRLLNLLGQDAGSDSIGDYNHAENLSKYLNSLDRKDKLTKTILYNLNPADNAVFASMVGNFNDGSIKGKVQYGSAWWFLDQKDGIINQLNTLSNMGLLSCFIGMLTDSRSFLSFSRHEYFRRILCNLFGKEIASGEIPNDMDLVGKTIVDISYNNAKEYFTF